MGKVSYSPGIEYVKGALAKPKKRDGHNHGDYLIGTHREAATTNPNCTRIYVRKGDTYVRTTALSQKEVGIRNRFVAVSRAVAVRAKNLSTLTQDQAAFAAQKDQPGGCKTFKKWLWKVEGDSYDESHQG